MNYNQIAEKIEKMVCERLEHFDDVPAVLLLGVEDYSTMEEYMMQHYNGRTPSKTGYQVISMMTSGGNVRIAKRPHIPSGTFVSVAPGQDEQQAYNDYYNNKMDRELNDIVYRIVEELE